VSSKNVYTVYPWIAGQARNDRGEDCFVATLLAMTKDYFMSPIETNKRTACEVYSRVVGYLRPVQQWNDGKQSEYYNRKMFKVSEN